MGGNLSFVSAGAFEPNDIEVMSLACEQVGDALQVNTDARAREVIAVRVIELTRRGGRCPALVRDRVLAEASAASDIGLMSSPGNGSIPRLRGTSPKRRIGRHPGDTRPTRPGRQDRQRDARQGFDR